MDYCSSCRRHLNGALVCPGCGAYAPDIAPVAVTPHTVQPRVTMATANEVPEPAPAWEPAASDPQDDDVSAETAPAPQGRAARRRQRIRWKKSQRRAVVATAVALVGGGLTFAALDHSADRAEAASAPEAMGGAAGSAEEESPRHSRPSPAPSDARWSSDAPAPRSPESAGDRGGPGGRTAATPASVAPRGSRPDALPSPGTTSASGHGSRSASSASSAAPGGPTGTASQQPSTAPSATDGSGGSGGSGSSGGTSGSDSGASPASPAPTATAPSQLCLLVVCLG